MNVGELIAAPLLRNAVLLAGDGGLLSDVTWAVPDKYLEFDNWIMPGLMLLVTDAYPNDTKWIETISHYLQYEPSAVVFFIDKEKEEDASGENQVSRWAIESWHNKNNLPLIGVRGSANTTSFLKHFALTAAMWFRQEAQQETWLQEVCTDSNFTNINSLAIQYGYNTEYNYYASILSISGKDGKGDIVSSEMERNMIQGFLHRELDLKEATVLSYTDNDKIIAFIPRGKIEERKDFRGRIEKAMRKPHSEVSDNKWRLYIGNKATDITQFKTSYQNALKTKIIIERLAISDRISYYNDYYMHMILLDQPSSKLREQMEYVLFPILNKPDLLDTLTNYLVFGESLKEASEKSFVHVNTLKYRLGRISDYLACDLKDPNVRFKLRMAITIYRYLEGPEVVE